MTNNLEKSPQLKARLAEFAVSIGARIRLARRRAGLSQSELARRLGVVSQQINKYESGIARVTSPMLLIIAEELGVSAPSLLAGTGDIEAALPKKRNLTENVRLLRAFAHLSEPLRDDLLGLAEAMAENQANAQSQA